MYSAKIKHSIGGTIFISMYKKLNKKFFKKLLKKENLKTTFLIGLVSFFIFTGIIIIWITSFELPSLDSFEERRVVQSTKIY
ncbi:MAG: hypothetical protein ACI9GH_000562, partial [Candidatus Paceibacteria bacterium]